MKVALVSTGLGRVTRGFESFTDSLFQSLRLFTPHLDVTLFQGGAEGGDRRIVVPNMHRQDVPSRWLGNEGGNLLEKRSFALALYPLLRKDGFDIIHYNELTMGSALFHLRRLFGGTYKLLYCNGAPSPPIHYHHRCDFAQMLHGPMYEDALRSGIAKSRLFLVPYGVDAKRYAPRESAAQWAARRDLGVPENARVVLTVAALNRCHKRIDYLIDEIARLDPTVWLVAAGQRTNETPSLEKEAAHRLPGRFRFVTWPQDRMHLLYGVANAFALCSLSEGFGLVTVEAMLSSIPVLVHDARVFHWIAGDSPVNFVNMAQPGALAEALAHILSNGSQPSARPEALRRFSWESLVPRYIQMYENIMHEARRDGTTPSTQSPDEPLCLNHG
jgi:1,2-diacylglycerol 3-alpha-glucosyltransferase